MYYFVALHSINWLKFLLSFSFHVNRQPSSFRALHNFHRMTNNRSKNIEKSKCNTRTRRGPRPGELHHDRMAEESHIADITSLINLHWSERLDICSWCRSEIVGRNARQVVFTLWSLLARFNYLHSTKHQLVDYQRDDVRWARECHVQSLE